jgi:hypothetical protein
MNNLTVRSLTDASQLDGGKTYMDLPILFSGSFEQCKLYCEMFCGYTFKPDSSVFGGYYAHEDGDCLFIV